MKHPLEIVKISLNSKYEKVWHTDRTSLWLYNLHDSQIPKPFVAKLIDSGCDIVVVSGKNAAEAHDEIDDICLEKKREDVLTVWNTDGLDDAAFNLLILRGKAGSRAILLAVSDRQHEKAGFILEEMQHAIERVLEEDADES